MTRDQALKILLPDGVITEPDYVGSQTHSHALSDTQYSSRLTDESVFALQLVEALTKLGFLVK